MSNVNTISNNKSLIKEDVMNTPTPVSTLSVITKPRSSFSLGDILGYTRRYTCLTIRANYYSFCNMVRSLRYIPYKGMHKYIGWNPRNWARDEAKYLLESRINKALTGEWKSWLECKYNGDYFISHMIDEIYENHLQMEYIRMTDAEIQNRIFAYGIAFMRQNEYDEANIIYWANGFCSMVGLPLYNY